MKNARLKNHQATKIAKHGVVVMSQKVQVYLKRNKQNSQENIYYTSVECLVQHQLHDFDPNVPHVLSFTSQYANANSTFSQPHIVDTQFLQVLTLALLAFFVSLAPTETRCLTRIPLETCSCIKFLTQLSHDFIEAPGAIIRTLKLC